MPVEYTSTLATDLAAGLLSRFERYVRVDTQSALDVDHTPSTPGQLELGKLLTAELLELGLADAAQDEKGYVTATLPGTVPGAPAIAVIAHVDTSTDAPASGVEPIVHRDYDGGVIELPKRGTRLDPATVPALADKVGHDIVTASGDTLLGADDKAGVAAIMTAVSHMVTDTETPRAAVKVVFTPDEEIGGLAADLDIDGLGARCAYTIDGSEIGELAFESFTALEVRLYIDGVDVHPGSAKDIMVSALRLMARVIDELPYDRLTPATTDGRDGFIHPLELRGTPDSAYCRLILRDFDEALLDSHLTLLRDTAERVVASEPKAQLRVEVKRQYRNMREAIEADPDVLAAAEEAYRAEGIEPVIEPIRGGTDGSSLSLRGLPTPNLFTGGHEYHSVREWASINDMAASAAVICRLAEAWGEAMSYTREDSLASLDGQIAPVSETVIPISDEGLIRGDGVFEVIRIVDGQPFKFAEHLDRLERSGTNIRLPVDREAVAADTWRLLAEAGSAPEHAALRIMLTRGGRRILMTEPMHPLPAVSRLASVTYSPTLVLDGIKSLSYAANMLMVRLAQERGFDDALLVTPGGTVLEATTSSIFWVRDGALHTPPLEDHILASITRALVFDVVAAGDIAAGRVLERSVDLDELLAADEVFLASTMRDVQPVAAVDATEFAAPGPVSAQLAAAVETYIAAWRAGL